MFSPNSPSSALFTFKNLTFALLRILHPSFGNEKEPIYIKKKKKKRLTLVVCKSSMANFA